MEDDGQEEKPSPTVFLIRHRSPAFSKEEVKALLRIVEQYKTIVFNKSTTATASQAKDAAWLKISRIFNRQGFENVRSTDSLKIKWDNMKKEARKVSKNLMDLRYSEFDEVTSQLVAMMCEAENNTSRVEEPMEPDADLNEIPNHKESIEINWNGNEDKNSDESSLDGDYENRRLSNRSMNFSPSECNLLLQCVRQEKNIVFSKTTTAGYNEMKKQAWKRITNSYNKLSPQKRSRKVLHTKFFNMKRAVKSTNLKSYFKQFGKKHQNLENSDQKIKAEPLFEYRSSLDADNDDDVIDHNIEPDQKSNSNANTSEDPLSAVLNSDIGISSISQFENKEIVKLKKDLLNYQMETAKLKRKRIEDLILADAAERETKAMESSLRLRAARLEVIAAEMKLPPGHPALAYTAEEARGQHYIHLQYHTP